MAAGVCVRAAPTCPGPPAHPSGAACALCLARRGEQRFTPWSPRTWGSLGQAPWVLLRRPATFGPQEPVRSSAPSLPPPPRSELIQLVAVTQKTAERSYREHIEQQIQTYQRRWAPPRPPLTPRLYPSLTLPVRAAEWGQ